MDYKAAYLAEKEKRIAAERILDEKTREVKSSMNMIRYQFDSLGKQKRGLELLLNVAQIGELRLAFNDAIKLFIDAIGQLFDAEYGVVYLRSEKTDEILTSSYLSYLPKEHYSDKVLELLSGQRTFDKNSKVGQRVLEGSNVVDINRLNLSITPDDATPDWLIYFPVRKNGHLVAISELGIRGWKTEHENYLSLAMIACTQIGVMLERADAHRKMEENYKALKEAHNELKSTQSQLVHSEKMASIGQLAAGVAHEINNPVGFVISNIDTLHDYMTVVLEVYRGYEVLLSATGPLNKEAENLRDQLDTVKRKHDFSFILDDIEQVIKDSTEGLVRVKDIVLSLRNFARTDEGELNLHCVDEILDESVKMIWNELKYHVELIKEFRAPEPIRCNAAQLSQVFINLIMNAAQAIKERGTIKITTSQTMRATTIWIEDNGCGISESVLSRIFDPFFTTKPVDVGTGLGLSISHGIIEQHGGQITVDSTTSIGTCFCIQLPNARI